MTDLDEVERVRYALRDRNIKYISRQIDVPYRTILDFAKSWTKQPSAQNFLKIKAYLEEADESIKNN